ncbi:MAG TPA: alpha/beta hydrolase [Leptospiraceae bacterium]|nr:alpha/beta hydrolase [Leptospiraceae bacterium]HMX33531.1 alpha/beta hydrolase [Leptospiraceae bacterium]HMY32032.1 alpha/beta hydrolase [Leptospiraceae bacterium]HMZ67023.1 alpha/beta hydrolase [Leptospiraceae bacterium]HNA07405.1 alpha/beta hydrolase [Leptospiraceae bacterium]
MNKKKSILLIVILLVLVYIPWFFSSMVLLPKTNCSKEHHVFCDTPSELNLKYETIKIKNQDGLELESWFIPADNSDKAILLVHGHGGSRNEGLRFAKVLNESGYNLLALSLRRNSGEFATMGFYEVNDVKAAVDFLIQEKKIKTVGIFGFSMGAATSILAMEKDNRIKAGLFSSGYASALNVLSEAANRDFGIPYYPLIPIVREVLNFRAKMKIEDVRPVDKIGNISPRPILIFHCDKDDYVDSSHAEELFKNAKEPKEKWVPACNKHEFIWNTHKEEAELRASNFFKKNL